MAGPISNRNTPQPVVAEAPSQQAEVTRAPASSNRGVDRMAGTARVEARTDNPSLLAGMEQSRSVFSGRYNSGDLVTAPATAGTVGVAQSYFGTLTAAERSTIAAADTGPLTRDKFDTVVSTLDTPEKLAAYGGTFFQWVDNHEQGGVGYDTHSPMKMFAGKKGVCRDQHEFYTFAINKNGGEAYTMGYASPGNVAHAVTVYKDADGWHAIEYGRIHTIGAPTREAAMMALSGGAMRFSEYSRSDDPSQGNAAVSKVYWTKTAMELKAFMANTSLQQSSTFTQTTSDGVSVGASVDSEGATLGGDFGKLSLRLRAWQSEEPSLQEAFGASVNYKATDWLNLHGGYINMPGAHYYSIGPRQRQDNPMQMLYAGATADGESTWSLTDRLALSAGGQARLFGTYAFSDEGMEAPVSEAMSSVDTTGQLKLSYAMSRNFSLWGGSTVDVPWNDVGHYWASGGRNVGEAPWSAFSEAGVKYDDGSAEAQAKVYVPHKISSNLHADETLLNLSVGYKLGQDLRLGAEVTTGTDLGLRQAAGTIDFKYLNATIGTRPDMGGGQEQFGTVGVKFGY